MIIYARMAGPSSAALVILTIIIILQAHFHRRPTIMVQNPTPRDTAATSTTTPTSPAARIKKIREDLQRLRQYCRMAIGEVPAGIQDQIREAFARLLGYVQL